MAKTIVIVKNFIFAISVCRLLESIYRLWEYEWFVVFRKSEFVWKTDAFDHREQWPGSYRPPMLTEGGASWPQLW